MHPKGIILYNLLIIRIVLGAKIPKQGYTEEDYPVHIHTTALQSVGNNCIIFLYSNFSNEGCRNTR